METTCPCLPYIRTTQISIVWLAHDKTQLTPPILLSWQNGAGYRILIDLPTGCVKNSCVESDLQFKKARLKKTHLV